MTKKRMAFLLLSLLFCLVSCDWMAEDPVAGEPEKETFSVHYLDVGQADCMLVISDGQTMLIDAGNNADSDFVLQYLGKLGISHLDYAVGTHAHEDHIGGLDEVLSAVAVEKVWLSPQESDAQMYLNVLDVLEEKNLALTRPVAGEEIRLGSAAVQVLAPAETEYSDINDSSLVLKIQYGKTSFLFTGDATRNSEAEMLEAGAPLSADVLKVGHHGSGESTSYVFLREIMPAYAVICVGAENSYGHPHEEVMSRLHDSGAAVYRTDLHGTIVAASDGETVSFRTERDVPAIASTRDRAAQEVVWIGNINTKKLHRDSCANLPAMENRVYFASRAAALEEGYEPCKQCKP